MVNVLVVLMIVAGVRTGACPIMCTCREYPRDPYQKTTLYYTSISCKTLPQNLTESLDNSTRDLKFSHLQEEDFLNFFDNIFEISQQLPFLNNLIIRESMMSLNLNASLSGLEHLHSLSLVHNKLETLPELFQNLSNLQTMDLSNNEIKVIELQPFRTLRALEVLNLSANSLTTIDSDSFLGLTILKCLDLSGNNLTALDNKLLLPLESLQYLNLSNNRLEMLNEVNFVSLVKLQQLDVSWNRLARVAPGSLQLPSLARLLLAGNPQLGGSREAAVLVGTGRRLQTVDASRTGLKQVPAALTHSIRTLRLAGNSIRSVSCGDLDSYPLLQLLDFTSNEIKVIEDDALGRLDSLSILYLTDNNMNDIPKSLPEKLKVLHLEHNNINRVSRDDLQGLAALEVLLLCGNKIRTVEEAAFSQLVSLVTLDLSRNPVSILQPGCLSGPPALQVLRLASIQIISPAEEVSFPLSSTEHLITLDLSASPGLARQLLADTAALAASRELQELDLSQTDLEFIRSDLLHYLPQLRVLHVKDNRLNCTGLQWLATWMRRQDDAEYRKIFCATPPELWGTLLMDLHDEEEQQLTEATTVINKLTTSWIPIKLNVDLKLNSSVSSKIKIKNNNIELNNLSNEIIDVPPQDKMVSSLKKEKNYDNKYLAANVTVKNGYFIRNKELKSESTSPYSITTLRMSNEDSSTTKQSPDTTIATTSSYNRNNKLLHSTLESVATAVPSTSEKIEKQAQENLKEIDKQERHNVFSDIFIDEAISNNKSERNKFKELEAALTIDENMTGNSSQWNITTGEMSMFTNNDRNVSFLHPGMLILAAGVFGAAAALVMLAARFTRRRRRNSMLFQQENIEVSSIPSVTELW